MSATSTKASGAQRCYGASLCGFGLLENFLPLYEKAEISSSVRSQRTPKDLGSLVAQVQMVISDKLGRPQTLTRSSR